MGCTWRTYEIHSIMERRKGQHGEYHSGTIEWGNALCVIGGITVMTMSIIVLTVDRQLVGKKVRKNNGCCKIYQ